MSDTKETQALEFLKRYRKMPEAEQCIKDNDYLTALNVLNKALTQQSEKDRVIAQMRRALGKYLKYFDDNNALDSEEHFIHGLREAIAACDKFMEGE